MFTNSSKRNCVYASVSKNSKIETKMIVKKYNYIFYFTIRLLNYISQKFIIQPLISIFKRLPISESRIQAVKKWHLKPTDSYDDGISVLGAFNIMMWSLSCFIITIGLLFVQIINGLELKNSFTFIFWTAITVSIAFNYLTLWRSDRYKKYCKQFKKEKRTNKDYFIAMAYHLTISVTCFFVAVQVSN